MAAMGITGFGKASARKQLDPSRFEKSKRTDAQVRSLSRPQDFYAHLKQVAVPPVAGPSKDTTETSSSVNPILAPAKTTADSNLEEPEYNPSDFEDDDGPSPAEDFPITHEIVLKDHTKVVSALTLDPSGARIASGSHDYDCKLWDFGGMDSRCKPFKSWEAAGSYYVCIQITTVFCLSYPPIDSRHQVFE